METFLVAAVALIVVVLVGLMVRLVLSPSKTNNQDNQDNQDNQNNQNNQNNQDNQDNTKPMDLVEPRQSTQAYLAAFDKLEKQCKGSACTPALRKKIADAARQARTSAQATVDALKAQSVVVTSAPYKAALSDLETAQKIVKQYPINATRWLGGSTRFLVFVGDEPMTSFTQAVVRTTGNEATFQAATGAGDYIKFGLAQIGNMKTDEPDAWQALQEMGGGWMGDGAVWGDASGRSSSRNIVWDTLQKPPRKVRLRAEMSARQQQVCDAIGAPGISGPEFSTGGILAGADGGDPLAVPKVPKDYLKGLDGKVVMATAGSASIVYQIPTQQGSVFLFQDGYVLGYDPNQGTTLSQNVISKVSIRNTMGTEGGVIWVLDGGMSGQGSALRLLLDVKYNLTAKELTDCVGGVKKPNAVGITQCFNRRTKGGYLYLGRTTSCILSDPVLVFEGKSTDPTQGDFYYPANTKDVNKCRVTIEPV